MKFSLDCYPCAVRQALAAVRRSKMSEEKQAEAMQQILRCLAEAEPGMSAPEITANVHGLLREMTGIEDLYKEDKEKSTREALEMYPKLKERVLQASDPLETAVRLSIAGNIIDFGPADSFDLNATIERTLEQPFALEDLDELRAAMSTAKDILYLADNAGETVFDRLLIETMERPVTYVVKEAPILNDATREDARAAGLEEVATVISSGVRYPGTLLAYCTPEFVERFRNADLIISKGMGNFESLSAEEGPIYFMLQVKCDMVGLDLGVTKGNIVATRKKNLPQS